MATLLSEHPEVLNGQRVAVAAALERFEHEAEHGVCDTGRYRCPYFVWGNGPPLLFIHGLADVGRSFVLPMSLLSQRFRCIGYDLPLGHLDGAILSRYHHQDLVLDALALLEQLGIPECQLYGSSFGSTIALELLRVRPERFPRGVLQGGFARRPLRLPELLLARLGRYWPGQLRHLPLSDFLNRLAHFQSFRQREVAAWDYYCACSSNVPIITAAHRAIVLHQVDLRSVLPRIQQPILLICGDRDPLVNKQCEAELLVGLPNVRRVEIAGCGHLPYFSHPETLVKHLEAFLLPAPTEDWR